ncbi:DUF6086 family protein [Streptomyces sp. 549]|uniref:DUF6086 family protein n=1 Tax=Streptomyces sp. 549 TaxID=3049076 RepID=UPI0024C4124B|nr:DUF6086 family protein [Streptomyces sp. 549]MDK1473075.1 DUF6086 family protein [Streptomyces sp. 549]
MSCYFQTHRDIVWNPSNSVARLFVQQVHQQSERLGVPSGLGPLAEDECEIHVETFASFVDASVRDFNNTNNAVKKALMRGVTLTCLVLAERAGLLAFETLESNWRDEVVELSRHMTRP